MVACKTNKIIAASHWAKILQGLPSTSCTAQCTKNRCAVSMTDVNVQWVDGKKCFFQHTCFGITPVAKETRKMLSGSILTIILALTDSLQQTDMKYWDQTKQRIIMYYNLWPHILQTFCTIKAMQALIIFIHPSSTYLALWSLVLSMGVQVMVGTLRVLV